MGDQSLGDRQDRIIGGFHHRWGSSFKRAEKEPKKFIQSTPTCIAFPEYDYDRHHDNFCRDAQK